ncbi:MAG: radical SAM protein [Planctomycetes bacterium]|uniref:radical SAM protein n=1 Tax=Candidatus Wunengus sp. YC65 TaxID=3367701 RepID=UPI001E1418F3|nr:radical SAM protein [Planctomycetota bacterium]MBI5796993.1 radical SAM protein [Planctomycetota bacterium]
MKITDSNLYEFNISLKEDISIARKEENLYLRKDDYSYKINYTAAKILNGLIRDRKLEEILRGISNQHNIEHRVIIQDTIEFLRELYLHGIINIYKNGAKLKIPHWEANALTSVQVILSRRCNLRCTHCFIANYNKEEMRLEELRLIFLQLLDRGAQFVHFSGGEVVCRQDIIKIFDLAINLGLDYGFNSNGTLISEKFVRELIRIPPSDISISLYGYTPDMHEKITNQRGTFEKTVNAIKLCLDAGLRVKVKTMVTKYNKNYLKDIVDYVTNLGVDQITFDPSITRKYDGDTAPLVYRISEEDLFNFDKSQYGRELKFQQRLPDSLICNAGIKRIAIDCDGTVYPCSVFPMSIGNLKFQTLDRILTESQKLKEYLQFRVKDLPNSCKLCTGFNYCSFCPGLSYIEQADYRSKCEFNCIRTKLNLYKVNN